MTNRQAAIKVIATLHSHGHQALLAGGCVRDRLLNKPAKDYDVATAATPDQVIKLFSRTRKVGAQFGVIMVLTGDQFVEVATFRKESDYPDGRHPSSVTFTDAQQDASRRDFTINGMFYDPIEKTVIDYVHGQKDLQKSLIRTIGAPDKRFAEDYLRLLRAIRFSTQLDFDIEKQTFKAICRHAPDITKISGERIAMELEATLTNPNRKKGADHLIKTELAFAIFSGLTKQAAQFGSDILSHLRKNVSFPLALAAFFASLDTDDAIHKCHILKLSNAHKKHLRFLLDNRSVLLNADMPLANLKMLAASAYFLDLYELQRAIQRSTSSPVSELTKIKKRVEQLKGTDLKPKPLLNGHQLIALGAKPGPTLGHLAEEMYIAQLSEKIKTPQQATAWIKKRLKK